MKAKNLGILSALTASACCVGPLLLILLGLGGLGLGAVIGKYHWYFILGAGVLLGFGWRGYFKEKTRCHSAHCEMQGKNITRNVLLVTSAVVLSFVGLNLYTYAKGASLEDISKQGVQVAIPVKGMSCFTCEMTVQKAVKGLPGVHSIKASAREGKAVVSYDPNKTSLDEIISAINKTGYKAEKPKL